MSSIVTKLTPPSKSEQTRQKLVAAGIHLFSTYGYNATSTRNIETHAEVQRNLINYHFDNKKEFWKACVRELFNGFNRNLRPAIGQANDIEPGERIRFLIRQFVRASAAHPEISRIMFDEGRCDDWRLKWLVDHFSRDFHRYVTQLYKDSKQRNVTPELSAPQFYYLLVSSSIMFAMAPERQLLFGADANQEALIDAQAESMANLLAPTLADQRT